MIGKHKTRAASFTLAHAGVLAVALVLAPLLGAQIEAMTAKSEMSTVDTRPVEKARSSSVRRCGRGGTATRKMRAT